jgi:hypothetical protein
MTQGSGSGLGEFRGHSPDDHGRAHGAWIERNVPSQSERSIRTPQEE